jgi:hypothetical protein
MLRTYLTLASNAGHGDFALESDSRGHIGVVIAAVDRESQNAAFKSSLWVDIKEEVL